MISGIIKVESEADNTYRDFNLPDITKTECDNCFIIHCFDENNDKDTDAWN